MHTLPELPYKYEDLEPYIDKTTMEIHHGKHHQAYVDNLNKALLGHGKLENVDVHKLLTLTNKIPDDIKQQVINNAGGHANHSFFWKVMIPRKGNTDPKGLLKEALEKQFGSVKLFKEKFSEKALGVFGSGWSFLILDKNQNLQIKRHSFQNSPIMQGNMPILGLDVWEHAYYLKYQNKRADYIKAWWNVVNWEQVEENFRSAGKMPLHN